MGPGDMSCPNRTSSAPRDGNPLRGKALRPATKRMALTLVLLGGILFWGGMTGLAKEKKPETRTVRGVTMDEANNLIQGAAIELTDLQTKKVLDIYSQEGGQYQFTDLRFDHDYTVQATYKNSTSEMKQVSSLDTRNPLVINLTLHKNSK